MKRHRFSNALVSLLVVTMAIGVQHPLYAVTYNSFMFEGDVLDYNDEVISGLGNQRLTIVNNPTIFGTRILLLRWIGSGPDFTIWNSFQDCEFDEGHGVHSCQYDVDQDQGVWAEMQGDGNFVLYDHIGDPMWDSNTDGNDGAYLNVQDDENMVIYSENDVPLWSLF